MATYDQRMRIFLTLECNLHCPYCVNRAFDPVATYPVTPARIWVPSVNRIGRNVIFTGGEPFLYPELIELVNGVDPKLEVRIYTNLTQDPAAFAAKVRRSVRFLVSYHPCSGSPEALLAHVQVLAAAKRFSGTVHAINWSGHSLAKAKSVLAKSRWTFNIDVDQKVKFAAMSSGTQRRLVTCTSENMLIAPNGIRYPCVSALLRNVLPQESIIKQWPKPNAVTVSCPDWGHCAACDGLTQRSLIFRDRPV
jgi:MoaA/NifB/PqqE/SkfB family radical SAM enzyme